MGTATEQRIVDLYKFAVIGRGLIGSAAARHLAEAVDGVVAVGPDEPKDRATHNSVFASHYDEGRMTRHVDPMREWSIAAGASLSRYRDIEARSGVSFYTPSGYLGLGYPGSTYNARCAETGTAHGAKFTCVGTQDIRAQFPFLNVPAGVDGLVETGGAGHISPRRMVEAQTRLAEQAGATFRRQAARALRPTLQGVEIELWGGELIQAERALIAAGAFTAACGLSPVDLGLTVYGRTTVLPRIAGDAATALATMPTMIDTLIGAYILPPIRYPDGHCYLKLGVGTVSDPKFFELDGLRAWFQSPGSEDNRTEFTTRMKELFPVLRGCTHWHTDTCAVTQTRSGLPILDFVHDNRVAVAVGGCGKGAKGADEWGRIAAGLLRGADWSSDVAQEKLARSR
ncbi:MAG: FAD-dependent oxidoreductase [Marinovum sp.]|nr:FAD-dependent oxidoreductase [Marinovum sp.]